MPPRLYDESLFDQLREIRSCGVSANVQGLCSIPVAKIQLAVIAAVEAGFEFKVKGARSGFHA